MRPMRVAVILAAALLAVSGACQGGISTARPLAMLAGEDGRWADDCAALPGFADFRARLAAAVRRRDVAALMPLLAKDITSTFGGDPGPDDFRRHWELDKPAASALWGELEAVLRLGCGAWDAASVTMPGYMARLPEKIDATSTVVAVRTALVRERASDAAREVATLPIGAVVSYEAGEGWDRPWTAVTVNGRSGWVRTAAVRPLLDYRAAIQRVGGQWKLTAFVAGD